VSADFPKILYCRCAFAKVVPDAVKNEVLDGLCASQASFESVSDLCEMSARKDPRLADLVSGESPVSIVACYPRAVKWLLHQAGVQLDEDRIEIVNMRESTAAEVLAKVLPVEP